RLGWGFLLQRPLEAVPAALSLVYQPAYMDILPVFIWCMLILPVFALLEARAGAWALLAPVAVYAAAWLVPPLLQPLPFPGPGSGFNPIAWQVLFLGGAWLGRRSLLTGQALPRHAWLTALAVVIVLAGFWLRLAWFGFLGWHAPVAESALMIGKENLALPRILHALALAWLVARFVPRDAAWMHGAFARGLATAGRYSLQVFCLGVFLSWGVMAAFRLFPGCVWWLDPLLIVTGGMALLLFARMLEQQRRAPRVAVPVSP
ncbi:MAG TPA: OpgC domain-containing protein, partial [Acetobacteraceae bacterium]